MRLLLIATAFMLYACSQDEEVQAGPIEPQWTCGSDGWQCPGARIVTDPDDPGEATCYWPCAKVTGADGEELHGRFWVFIDYIPDDPRPCFVSTRFEVGCVKHSEIE